MRILFAPLIFQHPPSSAAISTAAESSTIWISKSGGSTSARRARSALFAGDADLNGIVDGTDFLIWNLQFGMPGAPFPGAGSGSLGSGGVAVPEPASIALLATVGMLALALARRRTV